MKYFFLAFCLLGLNGCGFQGLAAEPRSLSETRNALWQVVPGVLETVDSQRDLLFTFRFPEKSKIHILMRVSGQKREFVFDHPGGEKDTLVFVSGADASRGLQVEIQAGPFRDRKAIKFDRIRPLDVYLVMHTHTDLGYTQPQVELVDLHMDYIDQAVAYARATQSRPDEEQFRWTCEVFWAVQNYLHSRPEDKIRDLIDQIKNGRIKLTALYLNQTALSGYEEMHRLLTDAAAAGKTLGVKINTVQNSDVNGIAWGFASLLPDYGIQNLSMAINWTKGGPPFREQCPNGFYWKGPDGQKVLVWNGDGYQQGNQLGLLPLAQSTPLKVSRYYTRLQKNGYPYNFALAQIQGIGGDNRPPNLDICEVVRDWNSRYRNPRLRTSTLSQFFERLRRQFTVLPEVSGDWPDWWSDGLGSTSIETGLSRRAQALMQSWHGAWKLGEKLMAGFAAGKEHEILAFNPSARSFKGPARVAVYRRGSSVFRSAYAILDEAGQSIPAEWISGSDWSFLNMEMDIPPLSFRRFTVAPGEKGPPLRSDIQASEKSLSSPFYRISWDARGVCSYFDFQSERELLDPDSPFLFGQVVYELLPNPNGGRSGRMVLESRDGKPQFVRHFASLDSVGVSHPGNFSRAIRFFQSIPGFSRVETEIRLYDHFPRRDVTVTLDKSMTYDPEAVYLPFPMDIDKPDVFLDLPGAVGRPWKQQLPGTCEDYYAVQDWVAIGDSAGGVIIASDEAPLFQFEKIRTGDWNRSGPPKNGTILGWPMNTYWYTNFAASQEPRQTFHYSLTTYSGPFEAHKAVDFDRQTVRGPIAFYYNRPSRGKETVPDKPAFTIDPDNVVIESIVPEPSGRGVLLRVRETSGKTGNARLGVAGRSFKMFLENVRDNRSMEMEQSNGTCSFALDAWQCLTFRLEKKQ